MTVECNNIWMSNLVIYLNLILFNYKIFEITKKKNNTIKFNIFLSSYILTHLKAKLYFVYTFYSSKTLESNPSPINFF